MLILVNIMHLLNDLYTIYGELLVKKDVEIRPIVVRKIRQKVARHKQAIVSLSHTDVFTDFEKVFDDRRYVNILKSPSVKKEVCGIAGSLQIENDVIFLTEEQGKNNIFHNCSFHRKA